MDFYHSIENRKTIIGYRTRCYKNCSLKHSPCYDKTVKQEPVEEIIIPPGKREEILNELRQVL